jgi:hypothetical protein
MLAASAVDGFYLDVKGGVNRGRAGRMLALKHSETALEVSEGGV